MTERSQSERSPREQGGLDPGSGEWLDFATLVTGPPRVTGAPIDVGAWMAQVEDAKADGYTYLTVPVKKLYRVATKSSHTFAPAVFHSLRREDALAALQEAVERVAAEYREIV